MGDFWAEQLAAVADLLIGVAHADDRFECDEEAAIRQLLAPLTRIEGLESVVCERLTVYEDSDATDTRSGRAWEPTAAVAKIRFNGRSDAVTLLKLLREVIDVDAHRHPRETEYFLAVGAALGLGDEARSMLAVPTMSEPPPTSPQS